MKDFITDEEMSQLESQGLAKSPDFISDADMERLNPPPVIQKPKTDYLKKAEGTVTSIFPGKQVGQSIGTLAGLGFEKLKGAFGGQDNSEFYDISAPSPLQVAGDVAKGAALVGGLRAPMPTTILGKAAQFGGISSVSTTGEGLVQKKSPQTIAKEAFISGLTGAVIGGTLGLVGKGIDKITARSPEALYNTALKVDQRIKTAGKSPAKFLKDEKVWGNLGSIQKAAQEGQERESQAIASKIASRISTGGDVITKNSEVKARAVEKLTKEFGSLYSKAEISQFVDDVPIHALKSSKGGLGLTEINTLRSELGRFLGDSKWLSQAPTEKTKAVRTVYGILADIVQSNTGTATEFARSSKWLTTIKVVNKAIEKADSKYGVGLYDIASGVGGAAIGGSRGDTAGNRIKNAVIGGVVGIGAERFANSPAVKTGAAQLISNISKMPTDSMGKISRTAVVELIRRLGIGNNPNE